MFSVIRNFDPIVLLEEEYNDTITTNYHNYIIHLAISQGRYEVVWKFLEKVPSSQKKCKILRF